MVSSLAWILLSGDTFENVYGLPPDQALVPFSQPGIVTIPLGFLTLIVGFARHAPRPATCVIAALIDHAFSGRLNSSRRRIGGENDVLGSCWLDAYRFYLRGGVQWRRVIRRRDDRRLHAPRFSGAKHSLADFRDKQAVVVVFLGTECPLAKLYGAAGGNGPRVSGERRRFRRHQLQPAGFAAGDRSLRPRAQDRLSDSEGPGRRGRRPVRRDADARGVCARSRRPRALSRAHRRPIRRRHARDAAGTNCRNCARRVLAGKPVSTASTEPVGCFIGRAKPSGRRARSRTRSTSRGSCTSTASAATGRGRSRRSR